MKKILNFLVIFVLILATQRTEAKLPQETIVLKLPNDSYTNWKEITCCVLENDGLVELIPCNEPITDWSEIIAIQYKNISLLKEGTNTPIKTLANSIRDGMLSPYPSNITSWRILEMNHNDFIYEWIVHKQFKDVPPQHEIARIFLTKSGFHRVAFTYKHSKINPYKREKWIKLLKDSVSVISFEEAANSDGLSMAKKFKDCLDLGPIFSKWRVLTLNTLPFGNGLRMTMRIPPTQAEDQVKESLDVISLPKLHTNSLDDLCECEKYLAQRKSKEEIQFHILKKSPKEIIYSYSHKSGDRILSGVVRAFSSDQGYYVITYKDTLNEKFQQKDILYWKEQLEKVKALE